MDVYQYCEPFISILTQQFGSEKPLETQSFDEAECKQEFERNGLSGLNSKLTKELEKWKTIPIHIAVTGKSGCGKSSFINALRNLNAESANAAMVGTKDTTKRLTPYKHPENEKFIIWDLPGVGTPEFPKKSYMKAVEYTMYDFFIILCSKRFEETDLWLAEEVKKQNKKFYFARTHIDEDLRNEKRDYPTSFIEENVLSMMRKDCEDKLQCKGLLSSSEVFLIDNSETDSFEFSALKETLLVSLDSLKSETDALKKEAIALTLTSATKKFMDEKKKSLLRRIPQVCLAITNAENDCEQKRIFKETLENYQKQFNIDEASLNENKALMMLTKTDIEHFRIVYDNFESSPGRYVKTPTEERTETRAWERFKDFFTSLLSKEQTLIYLYSKAALKRNLEYFHQQAKKVYDAKLARKIVKK
ncbi:T-cell-specific guanine nucleotide triphosphate-binding protein 2-like [Mercenaria mercenaria]|uniref:T-cell-specific guanine nucleotide triphosphate-binding protein 2-like n=1 Tax=Mercenaria mercenaria TaxID=6596 RepID=UPI00234FA5E9|nr:T-cell-specific guanine nucleotide triphosphate-binding protein 2-like [Mercenaria mercenaria]